MRELKSAGTAPERRTRGRRDWVKNAIIIFLAIMLVLMFFSNTIMNYSLPEVAAQYPQSTTLTTKIRGSGMVEAAKTYNVTVQETRTVASVSVKAGDKVAAGDTLLTLDERESQELTEARASLAALQLEYDKMTLSKGDQTHAAAATLQAARDAVTAAESALAEAQSYEADLRWYQDQVTAAQNALNARTKEKNDADSYVQSLSSQLSLVESSNADYLRAKERAANYPEDQEARARVQAIYDEQIAPAIASLNQQSADAQESAGYASQAVSAAQADLESANTALSQYQAEHTGAGTVDSAEAALRAAREALASTEAASADAQAQQDYDAALGKMDLEAKEKEIAAAQTRVEELERKSGAAKIVSRYAGTVQSVNVSAGDTTSAETPLMVVELTEQGYTLTATVTREQARALREGMTAEITNVFRSDITMTLTQIAVDQANPAASRTLTFAVKGEDLTMGQQLSFSVGDKNASYDVVIPSAAIHADADGSFVYTISVRPSPLGNRYTVQKATVEVIAADDTRSAVTGDLSTADMVVTTATVPLKVGDQVRIAE